MPSLTQLCRCIPTLQYEGYYIIYPLAVVVFICMAVLYPVTCCRIYFCQELHRNTNHRRQVFSSALLDQELILYRHSSCFSSCWCDFFKKPIGYSCPSPATTEIIDTRRPRCHRRQLQVRRKIVLHCAAALEPSPAYCPPEGVN